jgi:hypothetical protein
MDEPLSPEDELRRRLLVRLLSVGAFAGVPAGLVEAAWWGSRPSKMAEGKSIFTLEGDVTVNRQKASFDTIIRPGDRVETGPSSRAVFVVGTDSFLMRSNSTMEIEGSNFLLDSLRLVTGRVLSVFGKRNARQRLNLSTHTATIGIRGTGVYLESDPELTYVCTCYGSTEVRSAANPDDVAYVNTTHHDDPKYISNKPVKGTQIREAPFINHTDPELKMLEALVGREVPFGLEDDLYRNPRRDRY